MNPSIPPLSAVPPTAAPSSRTSWLYRLVLAAATTVVAITLGYFIIGLADGSVSSST